MDLVLPSTTVGIADDELDFKGVEQNEVRWHNGCGKCISQHNRKGLPGAWRSGTGCP